ncbi:MAG: bifunctional shikimate kinase/3-dehydroquinate synthase [Candidatus Dormiibacterota bacterium]
MKELFLPAPSLGGGRANLVLAGFSATGKTSVGALAAELLAMPFVDLDQAVERSSRCSLAELFRTQGEARFRELEAEMLSASARLSGAVIATGGGAVLHPEFKVLAASAVTLVLTASPEEIEARLSGAISRPLLAAAPRSRIRELLEERDQNYLDAGPAVDTTGCSIERVAAVISDRYRQEEPNRSRPVLVVGPQGEYPVAVGEGSVDRLDGLIRDQLPQAGRLVVLSDRAIVESAGARVEAALQLEGRRVFPMTIREGESSKELGAVTDIWDRWQALAVDRGDVIVAVGGGAALDAIGFAAATWGRGVPWVAVPTTILAMVDASIGGKVAIDRPGAKNAVGAFHHPRAVVCDRELLNTLPLHVARDGLAEVVKKATLASPLLLDALVQSPPLVDRLPPHLSWLIEQSARIKAAYVAADPQDHGLRQSLNLGHTYAHGLEVASDFRISHGRAVAVGMLAAARLGVDLQLTTAELPARLKLALDQLQLLQTLPALDRDRVRTALLLDKKRRGGDPAFVVPAMGGARLVTELDLGLALEPLWELLADGDGAVLARSAAPGPQEVPG